MKLLVSLQKIEMETQRTNMKNTIFYNMFLIYYPPFVIPSSKTSIHELLFFIGRSLQVSPIFDKIRFRNIDWHTLSDFKKDIYKVCF